MQDNDSRKKGLDFSFGTAEDEDNRLVFETEDIALEKPAVKVEAETRVKNTPPGAELHMPEKYVFGGAYSNSESRPNTLLGDVRPTYVPRFTDASRDYSIRESGESRTVKAANAKSTPEVVVVPYENINPTEELDEGTVVYESNVNVFEAENVDLGESHTTVFKFDNDLPLEEEAKAVPQPEPLPIPEPQPQKAAEEEKDETVNEPKEYRLPVEEIYGGPVEPRSAAPAVVAEEKIGDGGINKRKGGVSEFTAAPQRESFKDKFLDSIMSVKVRLVVSIIIFLGISVLENLWLFGIDIPAMIGISEIPGSMALLDAHFVAALLLLALPEVISAFHKLLIGRVTPELYIPLAAAFSIFYSVTVIIEAPESKYLLVGMLFGILTVSAIISSMLKRMADFSAFKMISSPAEKKIVDRKLTRSLPEENLAVDGRVESYKSKTARVYRTSFVADFFKRSGKCSENSRATVLTLSLVFGLSIISGAVAFSVSGFNLMTGAMILSVVMLLGLPIFSVASHKLPYYHASMEAKLENSAVIGEASLYDYAGVDVLTFRDTEIFTDEDVTLQRIMLYGKSENLEKAMHQMSAIFAVVGGPLETMFLDAIDHKAPRARNIKIETDGIVGEVGGCEVRAGTLEYMQRCGIVIPEDNSKEPGSLLSTKIMYAAENGEVYAKFYIRYTLSEEFTMILPMLLDDGITPLVYTRDPNVTNELFRNLTAGSDSIRVLKRNTLADGDSTVYDKISAGLVTTGDKINVINMLLLSKKYVRFQQRMTITEHSLTLVGAALGILLALTNMAVVPSVILAAWQIAWCAALYFMSKYTLSVPAGTYKH